MGSPLALASFWTIVIVASVALAWGVRLAVRRTPPTSGAFQGFGSFGRALAQLAALMPLMWVVAFALLVLRARLEIGEWPHSLAFDVRPLLTPVAIIDPKAMPLHHALLWLGVMVTPYLAVAVLILGLALRAWRPGLERTLCGLYFTGFALMALVFFADPGHYFDWFVD